MCRTLIIEDNPTFRQSLRNLLTSRFPSMAIEEAENGINGFEKIDTFNPHLIFVDIKLPGESGLETSRRIKTDYPDTVVIVLTNYDLPEYRQIAEQFGVNYFFSKSLTPTDEILQSVETIASNLPLIDGENTHTGQ